MGGATPWVELPGPAFEVELPAGAGQVQLVLASGAEERVAAWTRWPDRPSRALVDGSMIEIEDGRGVPRTLRAYPRSGDVWRLREATASGSAGGPERGVRRSPSRSGQSTAARNASAFPSSQRRARSARSAVAGVQ